MLYTFTYSNYDHQLLQQIFSQLNENDAIILWQDAVLLPLKNPELFIHTPARCGILQQDLNARGLPPLFAQLPSECQFKLEQLSLSEVVNWTKIYFPQMAN